MRLALWQRAVGYMSSGSVHLACVTITPAVFTSSADLCSSRTSAWSRARIVRGADRHGDEGRQALRQIGGSLAFSCRSAPSMTARTAAATSAGSGRPVPGQDLVDARGGDLRRVRAAARRPAGRPVRRWLPVEHPAAEELACVPPGVLVLQEEAAGPDLLDRVQAEGLIGDLDRRQESAPPSSRCRRRAGAESGSPCMPTP